MGTSRNQCLRHQQWFCELEDGVEHESLDNRKENSQCQGLWDWEIPNVSGPMLDPNALHPTWLSLQLQNKAQDTEILQEQIPFISHKEQMMSLPKSDQ